eukprot:1196355-Rhodomonas_salina.1
MSGTHLAYGATEIGPGAARTQSTPTAATTRSESKPRRSVSGTKCTAQASLWICFGVHAPGRICVWRICVSACLLVCACRC